MPNSEVEEIIAAPAASVWKFLGWRVETESLEQMMAANALPGSIEWSGDKLGDRRTITLPDGGGALIERLEAIDAPNYQYSYRIIDPGPMPVSDYLGYLKITAQGEDSCVVRFTADFNEEGYIEMHQNFCRGGIAAVRGILGV